MDDRRSLTEYAADVSRPGPSAWLPGIPEFAEVRDGWLSGVSLRAIRLWLINECGYAPDVATTNRLLYLTRHHPRSGD